MTGSAIRDTDGAGVPAIIDDLVRVQQGIAALEAERARLLTSAVMIAQSQATGSTRTERDLPLRSIAASIGTATRTSDRTVQARMDAAVILSDRFPATLQALTAGEIDLAHTRVIADAGLPIDDENARAEYEAAVLKIARRETAGRLRPAARLLAGRAHPITLTERHETAMTQRGVWVRDGDDGMADLCATLPAHLAHGIHDRLTQLARATIDARATGAAAVAEPAGSDGSATLALDGQPPARPDTRTLAELRADAFCDLLLTGAATADDIARAVPEQHAIRAHVQITIPATALLGGNAPATLAGHGPVDPATARRLAGNTTAWDRLLVHPVTGCLLTVDRYRPTPAQQRLLVARDEHCRFPGCRQPASRCDIDHTIAREHDGRTRTDNLAHLCRRHHTLKHHTAWRVRQHAETGVLEWTSPEGRVHPDRPARTLAFTASTPTSTDPPPF